MAPRQAVAPGPMAQCSPSAPTAQVSPTCTISRAPSAPLFLRTMTGLLPLRNCSYREAFSTARQIRPEISVAAPYLRSGPTEQILQLCIILFSAAEPDRAANWFCPATLFTERPMLILTRTEERYSNLRSPPLSFKSRL